MSFEVAEYILGGTGNFLDDDIETRIVQVRFTQETDVQEVQQWRLSGFDSNPSPGVKGLVADLGGGYKVSIAEKDGLTDSNLNPGERKVYSDLDGVEAASVKLQNDKKVAIGAKSLPFTSTPAAATGLELLELLDRILTLLQGTLTLPGDTTGTTFVPAALAELVLLQTDLNNIKGSL